MKKLFIFLSTIFIAVMAMTAWAQEKPKLSYQAVVRDNQNKLLNYSSVNVEINILKPNLVVQYSETFNGVATNQNGLMSLLIGNKSAWDDVDWFNAKINVKITLPDDMGVVESTFDVSAVPLAISAMYSDSVNLESIPQSDWNETNSAKCMFIKNKPNIIDTIVSNFSNPNSTANHIVDSIADNHIQWSMDTLISNRKLADSLNVARGALVDTAKNLRDAINDININLCTTVMDCAGIQTMRDSIQTNNVAIAANTTAISTETTNRINAKNEIKGIIKADSILFAGRVKNLNDSVKMNVQAIIDSSEHIRNEISAATAVLPSLETRFKADSTNLTDNYYTKTKINDTLSKYSTTSAMDARHYLTSDSLIITDMQDTLIKHNIRISANYKGIIDTAAAIRASINAITVNDAALTIQKNGADVATFSANANTDVTANVNVYDGKLYIKFNGDTLGHFTADQEDTVVVDIKLKQLSTCLRLTEATKDTLDYVEGFLDVTGLLLSVPDKYNCVDSTNCLIQLYINGVYIGSTATRDDVMKFINGKLYYFPAYNDNKVLKVNDRIEVIYWVK